MSLLNLAIAHANDNDNTKDNRISHCQFCALQLQELGSSGKMKQRIRLAIHEMETDHVWYKNISYTLANPVQIESFGAAQYLLPGLVLSLSPVNERRRYLATMSLIG